MRLHLDDPTDGTWEEILPFDGSATLAKSFLRANRADRALDALLAEVPWQSHELVLFGRKMTEPRLSAWIGDTGVAYRYSGVEREPLQWTPTLTEMRRVCEESTGARFNSVLANLYRNGQDSMGWHADDEPELGADPVIASMSFGDERRFDFRHRVSGTNVSVLLPHGSLLVMRGATQACWKHRIARTKASTAPRVNLTFRFVKPRS